MRIAAAPAAVTRSRPARSSVARICRGGSRNEGGKDVRSKARGHTRLMSGFHEEARDWLSQLLELDPGLTTAGLKASCRAFHRYSSTDTTTLHARPDCLKNEYHRRLAAILAAAG